MRCEKRSPILQFCELRDAEKNRLTEPSVCVFYFLWNLVTLKIGENKIGVSEPTAGAWRVACHVWLWVEQLLAVCVANEECCFALVPIHRACT